MPSAPAIVLAFANDSSSDQRYLRNLAKENQAIGKLLAPLAQAGRLTVHAIPNATIDDMIRAFQSGELRDRIRVFHFAGHASSSHLLFESQAGEPASAHAPGLAGFLGKQRDLVLVFLNGCSTGPQVRRLRDAGVKAVLATTSAIRDDVAAEFAAAFYAELAARSLRQAFETAVSLIQMRSGEDRGALLRDVKHGSDVDEPAWRLDCDPAVADWRLGTELVYDVLTAGTAPVPDRAPPSALLVARHTVVPWHDGGRTETLDDLDAWANDPRRNVAVRLLHGPAGAGKTRLAIEWVRRWRARHDVAGFLLPRQGEQWFDRLCRIGAPMLIVIDYAESRTDLVELLDRLSANDVAPVGRPRVRVLFLARSDGDWWGQLQKRSDAIGALLSQSDPIALQALATEAPDREAVFAEAAKVFANHLGKPAVQRPPIALTDEPFERVLYLHMAALAAVEGIAFEAGTLMDTILDHEQRFWRTEAAALHQASVDEALARQLVAAATLRGGIASEEHVQDLCERLARRERSRDDDALIQLLSHVYGCAGEPCYLPGLEPDLIGEAMVVRVAETRKQASRSARDPWISRVFVAGDDEQAVTTAFTVLGRLSRTTASPVRAWIAGLLDSELSVRAVLALRAAKAVGRHTAFSLLGDMLAEALEQHGSVELARALDEEQIPYPTVSLTRLASWRSQVLIHSLAAHTDEDSMARRARLLDQRGLDLAANAQRDAALAATREAVELYHRLAAMNPDTFLPALAMSLSSLAYRLNELSQRDASCAALRESIAVQRQLAARYADALLPVPEGRMHNLGVDLSDLDQRDAQLGATPEAEMLRSRLAATFLDRFAPDLAEAMHHMGNVLSDLDNLDAAVAATSAAIKLYRRLAATRPDAFLPDLAMNLDDLGIQLSSLGQFEAALAATREAVELYRGLTTRNPDAFFDDLARSLDNLSVDLSDLGQLDASLAATQEAAERRRQLAARSSDSDPPDAASSNNDRH